MTISTVMPNAIDEGRLRAYLGGRIPGITNIGIQQFRGGQSNPTYLLSTDAGSFVLRKKPSGSLLPSAHQIEREYRITNALQGSGVPVPRPILLCEDPEVIGTVFYVMEYVAGLVIHDPTLPNMAPADRRGIYTAMCHTVAALHEVDWGAAGLSDFGRPERYLVRQIDRWTEQYRAAVIHKPNPRVDELIDWLKANVPKPAAAAIVHGDFRLGNLLFSNDLTKIAAVLDWELSTLGDPVSDLAYCCLAYHLPVEAGGVRGLNSGDIKAAGFPTEDEFMDCYCRQTGLPGISNWGFYLAFSLFRRIAILQGVFARAVRGNASGDGAHEYGERANLLIQAAGEIAFGKGP
jgi:aminoglycoside phosphotransferase (APT) family kinase protein